MSKDNNPNLNDEDEYVPILSPLIPPNRGYIQVCTGYNYDHYQTALNLLKKPAVWIDPTKY